MQGTRGVLQQLPLALRSLREGDARSAAASSDGGNEGEEWVVVRWRLTPALGAGQLLLLAGLADNLAALQAEVHCTALSCMQM